MTVIYFEGKGQAMIEVECIAKEFSKSIRFMLADGSTVTIKRNDIISIENSDDDDDSIYQIICDGTGKENLTIENVQTGKFFAGYDFMGSVNWVSGGDEAYRMGIDEAEQIIRDLEDANETDEAIEATKIVPAFQTDLGNGLTVLTLHEDDCYSFYLKDEHHAFEYMFGLPMNQQTESEALRIAIAAAPDYVDILDD